MSEQQENPSASQEYANRLVDLADAEQRDRSARALAAQAPPYVTRQRTSRASLAVAALILMAILLASFGGPLLESVVETKPPASVGRAEAQKALDALVGEIEAFRKDYNELPETLVEIGVPSRGQWTYAVLGEGRYRVQGSLYGQGVTYESATQAGAK